MIELNICLYILPMRSLKRLFIQSFTHPHVVSKQHDLFSSVEHKKKYFGKSLKCFFLLKRGGRIGKGACVSQELNSGHPKRNGAICWCAIHEAIGIELSVSSFVFFLVHTIKLSFCGENYNFSNLCCAICHW